MTPEYIPVNPRYPDFDPNTLAARQLHTAYETRDAMDLRLFLLGGPLISWLFPRQTATWQAKRDSAQAIIEVLSA